VPTLTVLCGLPGSGKSTYAATLGATVLSADAIRERGESAGVVFGWLYIRARRLLAAGRDVVADTCALDVADRAALLALGRAAGARVELVYMRVDAEVCRARDAARAEGQRYRGEWNRARVKHSLSYNAVYREGFDRVTVVRG